MADKILTPDEERFLYNRLMEGLTLAECYLKYKPDTTQEPDSARRSGFKVQKRIIAKCGGWEQALGMEGIDPLAVASMLRDGLRATKIILRADKAVEVPDHMARIRCASLLADIFKMKEQTITIKTKEPLPLVVITTDGAGEIDDG